MTMDEFNKIIVTSIHERLKEKINAGIYCIIRDGSLFTKIKNDNTVWECVVPEIETYFCHGYRVERIIDKIVSEYRKEILGRYFY